MQVPRPLLERLGVQPHDRGSFRHPDGRVSEEEIGHVALRIGGRHVIAIAVFVGEDEELVVGWNSLLGLQLEADTDSERLVPKEFRMICHAS